MSRLNEVVSGGRERGRICASRLELDSEEGNVDGIHDANPMPVRPTAVASSREPDV